MTARDEQETTITYMRDGGVVHIYTSNTSDLIKLRNLVKSRDYVSEVRGGSDWGEFRCDAAFFFLLSAIRAKRTLSEATRAQRSAVLAAHRARQAVSS